MTASRRAGLWIARGVAPGVFILAIASHSSAQSTTFAAGTRDLFVLNFTGLKNDELPAGITSKGKEKAVVVTKDGVRMLKATERTELLVHLPENLPSTFTIQFEITPKYDGAPEDLSFEGTLEQNRGDASMHVLWQTPTLIAAGGGEYVQLAMPESLALRMPMVATRIDVSFDGGAFRLFTEGVLVMDLTNRQFVRGRVLRVVLGGGCNEPGKCVTPEDFDKYAVYMSKLRIAAGGGIVANNTNQTTNQSTGQNTNPPPNNTPTTIPVTVTSGRNAPVVSWPAIPGATGYVVSRRKIDDANCCNNSSGRTYGAVSPWQDAQLPTFGTYVYQVVAAMPGGQISGEAQFVFTGTVTGVLADPAPVTGTITPMTAQAGTSSTATTSTMADRSGPLNVPTGPAPTNLKFVGIPNTVRVSWDPVPDAVRYELAYAPAGSSTWTPLTITPLSIPFVSGPTTFWVGSPPDPTKSYSYRVIAYQPDGRMGETKADYKTPTMEPTNFTATPIGSGQVRLEWDNIKSQYDESFRLAGLLFGYVGDQVTYFLSGPGTGTGVIVLGSATGTAERNTYTLTNVPAGAQAWTLTVNWDPGGILTPSSSWAKAFARVETYVDPGPRYRLVVLGFKALTPSREINDAKDGQGDEVYFSAIVNRTRLTGDSLVVTKGANFSLIRTRSHGDEAVSVPFGRIKAGTASATGGIRGGDVVPLNLQLGAPTTALQSLSFPHVIWEGTLAESDAVIVHPALWEDDGNPVVHALWTQRVFELAQFGYLWRPTIPCGECGDNYRPYGPQVKPMASVIYSLATRNAYEGIQSESISNSAYGELGSAITAAADRFFECNTWGVYGIRRPCETHGVDRPIGVLGKYGWPEAKALERVIVLTRKTVAEAAGGKSYPGWAPGTFLLRLRDINPQSTKSADDTSSFEAVANYELFLRIERVP